LEFRPVRALGTNERQYGQVMPIKSLNSAEESTQGTTFEHTLLDCVMCGMFVIDAEGNIVAMSADAESLLRLPSAQRENPTLSKLPSPIQSLVREAQTTGQDVSSRPVVLHSGGVAITLSLSVLLVPAQPQELTVVLLKDISAGGKLERTLQHLDRLASIGTVSASMAHEIKNALVAVKTFIEMQLDKKRDAELGGLVHREMARVDSIVTQMLKFAAPAQPELSPVRLHEILDHSLRLVQHRIGSKLIAFNREFKAADDSLRGDDHQLEQAFVNLLLNAVEAIAMEGTLTVSTDLVSDDAQFGSSEGNEARQWLCTKIRDTGAGITAEKLDYIFEPFFTTKQSGTGLGLAVTRRVIAEHNGSIQVESHPGKGTTFTILLPLTLKGGAL
jgi:signal transduction histidine kinase